MAGVEFTPSTKGHDMAARITTFIVNGSDYFVANLENCGIRVGLKDCTHYDSPVNHKFYRMAAELETEAQAEDMHDFLTGVYCGERCA